MYVSRCNQGSCPYLVPGLVLHVHSQVPIPRAEDDDGKNHGLGADLVLTYGPHMQERSEETHIQQLRAVINDLHGQKPPAEVPKAPRLAVLDRFERPNRANWKRRKPPEKYNRSAGAIEIVCQTRIKIY